MSRFHGGLQRVVVRGSLMGTGVGGAAPRYTKESNTALVLRQALLEKNDPRSHLLVEVKECLRARRGHSFGF